LFEYYDKFDLSFLKGFAIIIPEKHLRPHERGPVAGTSAQLFNQYGEDLIKEFDPYNSNLFKDCFDNIELRLERMFSVKDKWTQQEIYT